METSTSNFNVPSASSWVLFLSKVNLLVFISSWKEENWLIVFIKLQVASLTVTPFYKMYY